MGAVSNSLSINKVNFGGNQNSQEGNNDSGYNVRKYSIFFLLYMSIITVYHLPEGRRPSQVTQIFPSIPISAMAYYGKEYSPPPQMTILLGQNNGIQTNVIFVTCEWGKELT